MNEMEEPVIDVERLKEENAVLKALKTDRGLKALLMQNGATYVSNADLEASDAFEVHAFISNDGIEFYLK